MVAGRTAGIAWPTESLRALISSISDSLWLLLMVDVWDRGLYSGWWGTLASEKGPVRDFPTSAVTTSHLYIS
jgi:hypothetical protein